MKWISVKDELPENDQTVITWNKRTNKFAIDTWNQCIPPGHMHGFWTKQSNENVTHWMVPDAPDELTIAAQGFASRFIAAHRDIDPDIAEYMREASIFDILKEKEEPQ